MKKRQAEGMQGIGCGEERQSAANVRAVTDSGIQGEPPPQPSTDAMRLANEVGVAYFAAALAEIAEGKGPYKRDPLKFAESVIESMQRIAREALAGTWAPSQEEDDALG